MTVPINNNNNIPSENLPDCYKAFYAATVDRYHGVLINSGNYACNLTSGAAMAEKYGQDFITVNRNYAMEIFKELHHWGKTIVVVTRDPAVNACAERHISLKHI